MSKKERAVVPMESSPEVFTRVARALGLDAAHAFVDVYSVDDEDLLAMVPRPVSAVVLLFPITGATPGEETVSPPLGSRARGVAPGSGPVWFKQTIKNACGLYAILHALGNNCALLESLPSPLLEYLRRSGNKSVFGDEADEFVAEISEKYIGNTSGDSDAYEGVAPQDIEVNLHFITFVVRDGRVYQLDGRQAGPIALGPAEPASDVLDQPLVRQQIRRLMDTASGSADSLHFSMLGLTETWD